MEAEYIGIFEGETIVVTLTEQYAKHHRVYRIQDSGALILLGNP